jgi:putative transposase
MGLELLAKSRIRIVTTEPDPTAGEPLATTEALTA